MTYKIYHLDVNGCMVLREATAEEVIEIDLKKNTSTSKDVINKPILDKICEIDLKRVRPLAEGDNAYLTILNEQIAALRKQLVK